MFTFADYSGVRAILGVSTKELPDSALSNQLYQNQLHLDLQQFGSSVVSDYETALAATDDASILFVTAFNVYVAYAVSSYCLPGLPQYSPKSVTDGKAGFSRHSDSPYKETQRRVEAGLSKARQDLLDNYEIYSGGEATTVAIQTLAVVSTLDTDPVTGA